MKIDKKTYQRLADAHAPRSPVFRNCFHAFWTGGLICTVGQALRDCFTMGLKMETDDAGTLTCATLILIAAVASGLGWFDRVAKLAGAGTLVPITGFANAVVSPAIDSHAEGLILGVGAKIFTVAGPVLLYGTLAGTLYGVLYWMAGTVL